MKEVIMQLRAEAKAYKQNLEAKYGDIWDEIALILVREGTNDMDKVRGLIAILLFSNNFDVIIEAESLIPNVDSEAARFNLAGIANIMSEKRAAGQ